MLWLVAHGCNQRHPLCAERVALNITTEQHHSSLQKGPIRTLADIYTLHPVAHVVHFPLQASDLRPSSTDYTVDASELLAAPMMYLGSQLGVRVICDLSFCPVASASTTEPLGAVQADSPTHGRHLRPGECALDTEPACKGLESFHQESGRECIRVKEREGWSSSQTRLRHRAHALRYAKMFPF